VELNAVEEIWVHFIVFLLLQHTSQLFEDFQLKLKQVVVVLAQHFENSLGSHVPDGQVERRNFGNDCLQNVQTEVKVGVAFQQGTEAVNA
jgi:hypothetical protein